MIISEELVDICSKLGLTPNQYLAYLLISEKNIALAYKYINEVGHFDAEDLKVLLEREYIFSTATGYKIKTEHGDFIKEDYELDQFVATSKVETMLNESTVVDKERMIEELWNTYPNHIKANNQNWLAKAVDKDEIGEIYFKIIKGSRKTHEEVMEKLRLSNTRNTIGGTPFAKMKISNFIKSRAWEYILDDGELSSGFTDYSKDR